MRSDLRTLLGRTLLAAHVAGAALAALVGVTLWLAPGTLGTWDEAAHTLTVDLGGGGTWPRLYAMCGAALLGLDVLWILYGRRPRPPLRHVVSEVPGGSVFLTRDSVEAGLRAAGEALAEVSRVRVTIQQAGLRRLLVHAQFTATEGASIQAISADLRAALRQHFEAMVRPADGTRVEYELEFLGFAGRPPRKPSGRAEAAPDDPPFTGPRYPIEEDDDVAQT